MRWITSLVLGFGAILAPRQAPAQTPSSSVEGRCFGFAFGTFAPALDWKGAGHPDRSSITTPSAPNNRDWAATGGATDSLLMLFPAWWPAGVAVSLGRTPGTPGDTVVGRATALVADGRVKAPTAPVRAWLVPCAR